MYGWPKGLTPESEVNAKQMHMNDLAYGENHIGNRAAGLGLLGDYIQPANRYGMVDPIERDIRGHQSDNAEGYYNGGKLPWHITASDESKLAPDSGQWTQKNIEGQYSYTPSIQQINQSAGLGSIPYANELRRYFKNEESPAGNSLNMPVPMKQ